jgi:hypothetical protein
MAGTLSSLPLSQQFDINGNPLSGCLLYVFQAGTTVPVIPYADFGLTVLLSNPLQADSSGRIPQFFLDDGSYRARLTTSGGTLVFDNDGIPTTGASTGGGGGGGGSSTTSLWQTGFSLWVPIDTTVSGFVRLNARTIGSVASGATERANADTQLLYEYLWANLPDSLAPVTGGRGVSALADFQANKPMGTLDMRGCGPFGLDTMGNSAANRIAAATSGALLLGAETSTALLSHTHTATGMTAATHSHSFSGTTGSDSPVHTHAPGGGGAFVTSASSTTAGVGSGVTVFQGASANTGSPSTTHTHSYSGNTGTSGSLSISGSTDTAGTGSSFSLLNPMRVGTWLMHL